MSAIFLLPVCLTYWPRKYTTRANPHVDNSHQVWSCYDHPLPSTAELQRLCLQTRHVTWWAWPLTLNSYRTWRVRDQPCHQVWRPYDHSFMTYRNGYLWTSGVNLDTAVWFPDPDFLLEWKISAIRRRFPLIFAFYIWMSAIFLLPVCLTYWSRMYTTRIDPLTKIEVDMTIHCRVTAFLVWWYVTRPGDLDLWPFDLEQLSLMAGHVTNPATKFEDPTTIPLSATSYNDSHWLALEMRTRPLRMRRITWLVNRGSKQLHIWNPWPRFAYSLYNFYWATTTIKGRLL